jgi:regulator of sirC expression with transglutaminase-like and TPR domain
VLAVTDPDLATLARWFRNELAPRLTPADTLVLYLGLHQTGEGRLLLADGGELPAPELAAWLAALPARRQVLLADVCYAARLEQAAEFPPHVVRCYAAAAAQPAPELPVTGPLRQVRAFCAETQAIAAADFGVAHDRYSLLGFLLVHAMRRQLAAGQPALETDRWLLDTQAELARLTPQARRLPLPAFVFYQQQPWVLAQTPAAPPPADVPAMAAALLPPPRSPPATTDWEALLALPAADLDLGRANLLLGRRYQPDLDVAAAERQLADLATELHRRIGAERNPERIVALLNQYLFAEQRLTAVDAPYPTDFLLHELLRERRGRCSALVSLYLALGYRLGLPLQAVCVPEHIFVRWVRQPGDGWAWPDDRPHLNIETTLGGRALADEQYTRLSDWQLTAKGRAFYLRPLAPRETAGALLSALAAALLRESRVAEADTAASQAIAINAGDAEAWNNLGLVRRRQLKPELARSCYLRALEIQPRFAAAWNNLGTVLTDPRERLAAYRQATTLAPDLADAWANTARVAFDAGEYDLAAQAAEQCRRLRYDLPADFLAALQRRRP